MKIILTLLISITIFSFNTFGQNTIKKKPSKGFDEKLAKKLGANEYGMKIYVFTLLKNGKAKFDAEKSKELFEGHMKNIGQLAEAGKLVMAGPFMDSKDWRGIYIFDVRTIKEAEELVLTDPAIKAGALEVEFHTWYGSAALMEVFKIHKKIQKEEF